MHIWAPSPDRVREAARRSIAWIPSYVEATVAMRIILARGLWIVREWRHRGTA